MVQGVDTLWYSAVMEAVLLWTTVRWLACPVRWARIAAASALGVLPTLWVLVRQNLYASPWWIEMLWPILTLSVVLWPWPKRYWFKSYGVYLLLSLMAGGVVTAVQSWVALWDPTVPFGLWGGGILALLAGLGWKTTSPRIRHWLGREHYGFLRLSMGRRQITLAVLWDTGNQLIEPYAGRPVVIVEKTALQRWLPADVWRWLEAWTPHAEPAVPEAWRGRLYTIPFRTLSGDGVLPVLVPDQAWGQYAGQWLAMKPVAVGVSQTAVSRDRTYQALASPAALNGQKERMGA
jgi:sigma-E processing peptidase SpoIIGA